MPKFMPKPSPLEPGTIPVGEMLVEKCEKWFLNLNKEKLLDYKMKHES